MPMLKTWDPGFSALTSALVFGDISRLFLCRSRRVLRSLCFLVRRDQLWPGQFMH